MAKQQHAISEEARRGISEGGRRGGLKYAEKRRAGIDSASLLAAAMKKREDDLLAQLPNATAAQQILVASAVASYGLVLQARASISRAARWCGTTDRLADGLKSAQVMLLRTLNALGIAQDADDDDTANGDPRTMAERITAGWREQQAAREKESTAENPNERDS